MSQGLEVAMIDAATYQRTLAELERLKRIERVALPIARAVAAWSDALGEPRRRLFGVVLRLAAALTPEDRAELLEQGR